MDILLCFILLIIVVVIQQALIVLYLQSHEVSGHISHGRQCCKALGITLERHDSMSHCEASINAIWKVQLIDPSRDRFHGNYPANTKPRTADDNMASVSVNLSDISSSFLLDFWPLTISRRQKQRAKLFQCEQYVKQVRFLREDSGNVQVNASVYRSMGKNADPHIMSISESSL